MAVFFFGPKRAVLDPEEWLAKRRRKGRLFSVDVDLYQHPGLGAPEDPFPPIPMEGVDHQWYQDIKEAK